MGERNRDPKRALLVEALLCGAAAMLTGCSTSSYAGNSLTPGAADAELQELAMRARSGDKHALLELGIRYEEGRRVPQDFSRAKRLYAAAALDQGGSTHLYVPAAAGVPGRVIRVDLGVPRKGLRAAKRRLSRLSRLSRRGRTATRPRSCAM